MKLKRLLWYLAGSAAVLGCWTLARAITQLLTGAGAGAQVFWPVVLSPLISLPLGLFGAMLGHMAEKNQAKRLVRQRALYGGQRACHHPCHR